MSHEDKTEISIEIVGSKSKDIFSHLKTCRFDDQNNIKTKTTLNGTLNTKKVHVADGTAQKIFSSH